MLCGFRRAISFFVVAPRPVPPAIAETKHTAFLIPFVHIELLKPRAPLELMEVIIDLNMDLLEGIEQESMKTASSSTAPPARVEEAKQTLTDAGVSKRFLKKCQEVVVDRATFGPSPKSPPSPPEPLAIADGMVDPQGEDRAPVPPVPAVPQTPAPGTTLGGEPTADPPAGNVAGVPDVD